MAIQLTHGSNNMSVKPNVERGYLKLLSGPIRTKEMIESGHLFGTTRLDERRIDFMSVQVSRRYIYTSTYAALTLYQLGKQILPNYFAPSLLKRYIGLNPKIQKHKHISQQNFQLISKVSLLLSHRKVLLTPI